MDVLLHQEVDDAEEDKSYNTTSLAAQHESSECLRVLLDFGWM
jgi:hypothetical protein